MGVSSRMTGILDRGLEVEISQNPTKEELRSIVQEYKADGLCGRRIAEHRLGPHFIASDRHGQREIELLDKILDEEYAGSSMCIRDRQSGCSRLRGGCKRS